MRRARPGAYTGGISGRTTKTGGVRVAHLTGATIVDAPPCCQSCTWWQERGARAVDKRRWIEEVEERHGPWGKLYLDGDRLVGILQYGPAEAFPRARRLPAGPPSDDAALITCAFLVDAASPWALQSLILAAVGELRDGGCTAIEAFAYRHEPGEAFSQRFLQHRTVFPADFLSDFGFRVVRQAGRVELMRLELAGIVPVEEPAHVQLLHAWEAWRSRKLARAPAAP